jgi:IgA Peptidase M64
MDVLFSTSPFKERRDDFNVWGLCPPAVQPGISRPSLGIHRRSPVGATYDAFGSERYILTFDNRAFRDLASHAPTKGYFRSQTDCIMFTRDDVPFCAACRAAIDRILDLYAPPLPAGSGPAR